MLLTRLPALANCSKFTRKSVEGLSILLFVFAFAGNSFYVASILANPLMDEPRPRSTEFILESLPYLIGRCEPLWLPLKMRLLTPLPLWFAAEARSASTSASSRRLSSMAAQNRCLSIPIGRGILRTATGTGRIRTRVRGTGRSQLTLSRHLCFTEAPTRAFSLELSRPAGRAASVTGRPQQGDSAPRADPGLGSPGRGVACGSPVRTTRLASNSAAILIRAATAAVRGRAGPRRLLLGR